MIYAQATTVRDFAETVGKVCANYCFAIANKSGTELDAVRSWRPWGLRLAAMA